MTAGGWAVPLFANDDQSGTIDGRATAKPPVGALTALESAPTALLLLAGTTVLWAMWALLWPRQMLSQEMTWDLLFNLTGAWHLQFGHVPHLDFHDPVGRFNFYLTYLGFSIAGLSPKAFLAGNAMVALAIFAAASFAAWRRLPPLPGATFVAFACLLVLMPANVGDQPNAYSFAMSYNRYGWAGVSILGLIIFLPPRLWRTGDFGDVGITALLLTALFYLKLTYCLAGLVMIMIGLGACPHVWRQRRGYIAVVLVGLGLLIAPFNRPYLSDLFDVVQAGGIRDSLLLHANNFFSNASEYAPYLAAMGIALRMWWLGNAPLRLPVGTAVLLVLGVGLLSQNAQTHGLPLAIVIAFLFYDVVRRQRLGRQPGGGIALLLALLTFPMLSLTASAVSLAGYHVKATRQSLLVVVGTNLAGLAVPADKRGLLEAFSRGSGDYHLLNRARAVGVRYELSPYEYVETLVEAADLLVRNGLNWGAIALLDQVNPLPFMLGLEPPRGGNLWSGAGTIMPEARQFLGGVDHVLIPKFSTYSPWTDAAIEAYGSYLAEHFPRRLESRSWILLSRAQDPEESPARQAVVFEAP